MFKRTPKHIGQVIIALVSFGLIVAGLYSIARGSLSECVQNGLQEDVEINHEKFVVPYEVDRRARYIWNKSLGYPTKGAIPLLEYAAGIVSLDAQNMPLYVQIHKDLGLRYYRNGDCQQAVNSYQFALKALDQYKPAVDDHSYGEVSSLLTRAQERLSTH